MGCPNRHPFSETTEGCRHLTWKKCPVSNLPGAVPPLKNSRSFPWRTASLAPWILHLQRTPTLLQMKKCKTQPLTGCGAWQFQLSLAVCRLSLLSCDRWTSKATGTGIWGSASFSDSHFLYIFELTIPTFLLAVWTTWAASGILSNKFG